MKVNKKTKDLSILVGNVLAHFDTSLYSFLAPLLAPIFFPQYEPATQLILTYTIPIISFCAKPLGSIIFGIIAQIICPGKALRYSLIGLAVVAILTGFLPSYKELGAFAPVGLIIMRIIGNILSGGESIIAKLYIMEDKEAAEEFKASYFYQTSSMIGIILSSLMSAITIAAANKGYSEAWRVCFWLGGCVGFIGYFLRQNQLTLTSINHHYNFYNYTTLFWKSLINHKSNILRIAITTGFSHLTYSLPFIIMNSLIPLISQVTLENMMKLNNLLLIIDMLLIPLIGYLINKLNPSKIMIKAALMLVVSIIPLWQGLYTGSLFYITFVRFWVVLWGVIFLCPLNLWHKRLITAPEQYFLIGIGTSLGSAIGHFTTAICLLLWKTTGASISIALYVVFIGLATIYSITSIK